MLKQSNFKGNLINMLQQIVLRVIERNVLSIKRQLNLN